VRATYPSSRRRNALAPSILAVIALLIGVAVITNELFLIVRYAVSILALVMSVFAWQARQWWWLIGLVPVAMLWNPVFPIDIDAPDLWLALQYVAALVMLAAGLLIVTEDAARS